MIIDANFRRQARVCLALAEAYDNGDLSERLKAMAANLLAEAEETEDGPYENRTGEPAYRA
jgi:hypothetical protein